MVLGDIWEEGEQTGSWDLMVLGVLRFGMEDAGEDAGATSWPG